MYEHYNSRISFIKFSKASNSLGENLAILMKARLLEDVLPKIYLYHMLIILPSNKKCHLQSDKLEINFPKIWTLEVSLIIQIMPRLTNKSIQTTCHYLSDDTGHRCWLHNHTWWLVIIQKITKTIYKSFTFVENCNFSFDVNKNLCNSTIYICISICLSVQTIFKVCKESNLDFLLQISTGASDDYFQPIFITRETRFFLMFRP